MKKYNLRAYGICENENGELLVCHENIRGLEMWKFPGGGNEWGEGLKDTVIREFQEEMGLEISHLEHLYTTDFFQQSAFNENDQLISVYFWVLDKIPSNIPDFDEEGHHISFHWKTREEIKELLTFPVDQFVLKTFFGI